MRLILSSRVPINRPPDARAGTTGRDKPTAGMGGGDALLRHASIISSTAASLVKSAFTRFSACSAKLLPTGTGLPTVPRYSTRPLLGP